MEDERQEELESLRAIFPELEVDSHEPFAFTLELAVSPLAPLLIRFVPGGQPSNSTAGSAAHIERDVRTSHLPPLTLQVTLPAKYPQDAPPHIHLSTQLDWLPKDKVLDLERDLVSLWQEYGCTQILYIYIDHIQQAAEQGFGLAQTAEGCLILPANLEKAIVAFDATTKQSVFDAGTYDCGVCLERRKGSECYQMEECEHIFCRECLQGYYNNAITEGDIAGIRCLDPGCGKQNPDGTATRLKRRRERTLHPRELLAMGIEEHFVRRFLELERKKRLEADKSTVYCPRTWCQGPAKSSKYPPIPADLASYVATEAMTSNGTEDDADATIAAAASTSQKGKGSQPDPVDRLAICEKCSFAFCRVCYMGWHGPFARCYPRDPNELSVEEKASYDYIRQHTSPCAYCNVPVQKTMGCNHMCCFQCRTHFCYLCGSWLDANQPYKHFNTPGTPCYQRLWELEEGDDGQRPADGQGFGGGRAWEQLAIEAARQAEADEAEAAGAAAAEAAPVRGGPAAANIEALAHDLDQVHLDHDPDVELIIRQGLAENGVALHNEDEQRGRQQQNRPGRRQRNPFPARPRGVGAANAVRNHERAQGRRGPARAPVANIEAGVWDERMREEIRRFVHLAERDEEDGWNSDDLADDDDEIRFVRDVR